MSRSSEFCEPQSSTAEPSTSGLSIPEPSQLDNFPYFSEFNYAMANSLFNIREIARSAQDVFTDVEKLEEIEKEMFDLILQNIKDNTLVNIAFNSIRIETEFDDIPYDTLDGKILNYLFVLNTLNFALWYPKDTKQWTVCGRTGYKALCRAIKRAFYEGKPIWDANYYSKITQSEAEVIFRSDDDETKIPLIEERVRTLHEIGRVLLDKYKGTFVNCIEICKDDSIKLLYILFHEFESYRDKVNYNGKEVYFVSKALTLISDLDYFRKINANTHYISTMFVDHYAPRVFLKQGILRYSDKLVTRFAENNEPLENGSREEIEIRCCSLNVFQLLVDKLLVKFRDYIRDHDLQNRLQSVMPTIIDNYLWLYRHDMDNDGFLDTIPFHNIRSVYY